MVGAALGNRVFYRFGDISMRPNIWCLIVAPSSSCRKSTSIAIGQRLFERSLGHRTLPSAFSQEAFMGILDGNPEGLIFSSEFLDLIGCVKKPYNDGLMGFMSDMYDCPPRYTRTLRKQTFTITNPSLSILAATTVEWMVEKIDPEDWAGGFIPRFLLVPFMGERTKFMALPPPADNVVASQLEAELGLFSECFGEFKLSPEVIKQYEEWYFRHSSREGMPPMFSGSQHRMATTALKLAMIYHAMADRRSVRGEAYISSEAMKMATDDIGELFGLLCSLTNDRVAFTSFERDKNTILQILVSRGGSLGHSKLLKYSRMRAFQFKGLMDTLMESGVVLAKSERSANGAYKAVYYLNDTAEG